MKYICFPIVVCSLASYAISVPIIEKFTDFRDQQTYKTVKIGSKTWMAQNLDYKMPGSACYENDDKNCKIYGRLYTFGSAVKACPTGWHLPDDEEWTMLKRFIEDSDGKEAAWVSLKSRDKWDGSDRYGFDVVPAGKASDGFFDLGVSAHFWSATEEDGDAFGWHLAPPGDFSREFDISTNMYSVRCLKN